MTIVQGYLEGFDRVDLVGGAGHRGEIKLYEVAVHSWFR